MSATPSTGARPASPPPRSVTGVVPGQAWYAVGIFMACYTLSYIDRQILGTFVGPIKADFGLSDSQFGALQGFYFAVFYTFIGLPLGYWIDKTNRRNLIVLGVLIWSFFTTSCAFASSYTTLLISRMGVGIGEATLGPAAFSIMADLFPKERMGVAASVFYWGNLVGAGLALLIGGAVREAVTTMQPWHIPFMGDVIGWRLVFVMLGIPGMIFAFLVFTVKEPKRTSLAMVGGEKVNPTPVEALAEMRKRWHSVVGISLAFSFQAAANYGFMGWATEFFLRVHHWGPGQTTRALGTLIMTCGVAGLYIGGWISDRLHRKGVIDAPLLVSIPSAIGIVVFLTAAMLAPTPEMSLMFAAPGLFTIALPMGVASASLTYIFPNQFRGFVTALYLFILNLGGLPIGNYVPGLLADKFFHDPLKIGTSAAITIGVCGTLMLLLILATRSKYREHYRMMHSQG